MTAKKDRTGIETIAFEGLVTIKMFDGSEVQTVRRMHLQVDMNGPQSSQFVSQLPIEQYRDFTEPYGMVDSDNPLIRQFFDRMMDVIASPNANGQNQCFDVPARSAEGQS